MTYDLSESAYDDDKDDTLSEFLENLGFSDCLNKEDLPATSMIKPVSSTDSISDLKNRILEYCKAENIEIENLVVMGPAPVEIFSIYECE